MNVQLGIAIEEVAADDSESGAPGVRVADVFNDSPAIKAGIRAGDVIVAYNGEIVSESHQLRRLVGATEPGSSVPVEILRGADRITVTARF
jgi:serine protease Do